MLNVTILFIESRNVEQSVSIFVNLLSWLISQGIFVNRSHKKNYSLQWCHNGHNGVSNHQPHRCLLNRLFRRRPKKTSKLRVTGLCAGNSLVTGEFPAHRASNAENVSIWWLHHVLNAFCCTASLCFWFNSGFWMGSKMLLFQVVSLYFFCCYNFSSLSPGWFIITVCGSTCAQEAS